MRWAEAAIAIVIMTSLPFDAIGVLLVYEAVRDLLAAESEDG